MASYLITGGGGFIGRNVIERLTSGGHNILQYTRHSGSIFSFVCRHNPDYIIHCAGETENENNMIQSNVVLTNDLLDAARMVPNLKGVIMVGSSTECAPTNLLMQHGQPIDPVDIYGATKASATVLCLAYARQYGVPVAVVRPMSLYGKYDKPYHLIPTLYEAATSSKSIDLYCGGHDWMEINEFVRGMMTVLHSGADVMRGDVLFLGTGINTSNQEVLNTMESVMGVTIKHKINTGHLCRYDREVWTCDTQYVTNKYGFIADPNKTLENGLSSYVKWRRSTGPQSVS